jgi:hypothetical protein
MCKDKVRAPNKGKGGMRFEYQHFRQKKVIEFLRKARENFVRDERHLKNQRTMKMMKNKKLLGFLNMNKYRKRAKLNRCPKKRYVSDNKVLKTRLHLIQR